MKRALLLTSLALLAIAAGRAAFITAAEWMTHVGCDIEEDD